MMKKRWITASILTLTIGTAGAAAMLTRGNGRSREAPAAFVATPPELPGETKRATAVDVVFAIDTTGSMGGLIDGAKRTVWSIAKHIADTDKNVQVRIGLVAYRDIGDAYVTKVFDLNDDLDKVFAELQTYQADGGGDTPEHVDRALSDALHVVTWNDQASRAIFLVGDAPPAERGDTPGFAELAREAKSRDITINTIRCGTDAMTGQVWKQIAMATDGDFSSIQQDGGVQVVDTPYDQKMAELSRAVDRTTMIYGEQGYRKGYEGKMAAAAAAPAAAAADRGAYYAKTGSGGGGGRDHQDLLDADKNGVDIGTIPDAELPDDLRGLTVDAKKEKIAEAARQRSQAAGELAVLAAKRDAYLESERARSPAKEGGFDDSVKKSVEKIVKKPAK